MGEPRENSSLRFGFGLCLHRLDAISVDEAFPLNEEEKILNC